MRGGRALACDFVCVPRVGKDGTLRRFTVVLRDVELAVWIMLADVDRYAAMPPELRRRPVIAARRRLLADNLRRLRERLDM